MTQYAIGTMFEDKEADSPTRGKHPAAKHLVGQFFPLDELSKPVSESLDPARGFAIHAFDDLVAVPSELDLIASGAALGEISLNSKTRSVLEKRAGFIPTGDTLADFLIEAWGSQADPTGQSRNLPAMPAVWPGERRLGPQLKFLHSLEPGGVITSPLKFDRTKELPGISLSIIEDCLKHQNAENAKTDHALTEKILAAQGMEVFGLSRRDAMKAENYERLIPATGDGSRLRPRHPETIYTRLFSDEANNNTISNATEYNFNTATDMFEIINGSGVSNKNTAAGSAVRLDSDLSSDNHQIRASVVMRSGTSGNAGLGTRCTSVSNTCMRFVASANSDAMSIAILTNGSGSALVSLATGGIEAETLLVRAYSISSNHVWEVTTAGGTLYSVAATDTTVNSSNTRCGLQATSSATASNNHYWHTVKWQDYVGRPLANHRMEHRGIS